MSNSETAELSPEAWQDIAAMNARVYAMPDEDRAAWYAAHPVTAEQED